MKTSADSRRRTRVPKRFQPLLGLARTWGLADDAGRVEFLELSPLAAKRAVVQMVFPHLDALDNWIASQDHAGPIPREVSALQFLSQAASEAMIDLY